MIYQPRDKGDAIYTALLPALIVLDNGLRMHRNIKVLVQVRNRKKYAILAGWDESNEPHYSYMPIGYFEGTTINVN